MPYRPRALVNASLDAAGIFDPLLRKDFDDCRRLHAEHGRTYYLATWLLPPGRRPWVWALYGFARHCDEFVDSSSPDPQELLTWTDRLLDALAHDQAGWDAPSRALLATRVALDLPVGELEAFVQSMKSDIDVSRYETYDDLLGYMAGSACAIGSLMLPLLTRDRDDATVETQARALGEAFQLTNFLRDVGEDLDRGRIYLPRHDLAQFGLAEQDLHDMRGGAPVSVKWRNLMQFEISRARRIYDDASPGIDALDPEVRDGIRCARILYGEILDAIEAIDYQVLTRRARVPRRRQANVAGTGILRIVRQRRR